MTTDYFDAVWDQGVQLGLAGLDLREYVQDEMSAEHERTLEPERLRLSELRLSNAELRLRAAEREGQDELKRVREELAAETRSREEEVRMTKLRRQEERKKAREKQEEEPKIAREKQTENELRRQEERRIRELEWEEVWLILDLIIEEELEAAELKKQGELSMPNNVVCEPWQEQHVQLRGTAQISPSILELPDLEESVKLCTDASADAVAGVILQEHDGILSPVGFGSRKLCERQMRWSISDREYLVIWSSLKFKRYFVVQSDHQTLNILKSSETTLGRPQRWSWARQPFPFRFKYFRGNDSLCEFLWRHFRFRFHWILGIRICRGYKFLGGICYRVYLLGSSEGLINIDRTFGHTVGG